MWPLEIEWAAPYARGATQGEYMNVRGAIDFFFFASFVALALFAVRGYAATPNEPASPPAPSTAACAPMVGGHAGTMDGGMMDRAYVVADGGDREFTMRVPGPLGMGPMMGGAGFGDMGGMMKMMHALAALDLTPEQNKQRELLLLAHRKEAIALTSQIETADVDVDTLLLADPIALDKVKAKVKEKHDAAAKLEVGHIELMQDVKKLLTPEQRKALDAAMLQEAPMWRCRGAAGGASMMGPSMMGPGTMMQPPPPAPSN